MTPRPDWRHQPRRRPILPPREAAEMEAWHRVLEREWARLHLPNVKP